MVRQPGTAALFGALLTVFSCVLIPATADAQPSYLIRFQSAAVELLECQHIADDWSRQAAVAAFLLGITAICGGVIAVIQGLHNVKVKTATVLLGAIVSTVTVVGTASLDGDYKTLRRRANAGQILIASAQNWLKSKDSANDDNDRDKILQEIETRVTTFHQLSGELHASVSPTASNTRPALTRFSFEPVLHAQSSRCGCLPQHQQPPASLYFCGTGSGASISAAKTQATTQALAAASQALSRNAAKGFEQTGGLAVYAERVATEADSCVTPAKGGFQVSVLLQMPRTLTEPRALEAFVSSARSAVRRDAFVARWKLNRPRSQMGIHDEVLEEGA